MNIEQNQIPPLKPCYRCGGTGVIDYITLGSTTRPICRTCGGTGTIRVQDPSR